MFREKPVLTGIPAFALENPEGLCYVRQTSQNHERKGFSHLGAPVGGAERMVPIASIDLGTHTARLLVARPTGNDSEFEPLVRKRTVIRLAQGIDREDGGPLCEEAMARALEALGQFSRIVRRLEGEIVQAVCTGVVRTAANRDLFLRRVAQETGVQARAITGEEEAVFTQKGVLASLGKPEGAFILFDLGGGSTEFVYRTNCGEQGVAIRSLPLGALLLKEAFLRNDPPREEELQALSARIDAVLMEGLPRRDDFSATPHLIGTGGTAATLAAMARGIGTESIAPERMNGLAVSREVLGSLFDRIIHLPVLRRRDLPGLDPGRADVLPAGALAVLRIMHHFEVLELTVCLSDILEGLLIDYLEEDCHG